MSDVQLTDAIALCWVRDQLEDSGLFTTVGAGRLARDPGNDGYPAAWVSPLGFTESDDVDPVQITRTLRFAVGIKIKPSDPDDDMGSLTELDTLSNSVADLLSASGPDGSLPGLTRIESGSYQQPNSATTPTGSQNTIGITLAGSIAYLIEGRGGRPSDEFGD